MYQNSKYIMLCFYSIISSMFQSLTQLNFQFQLKIDYSYLKDFVGLKQASLPALIL